MLSNYLKLALRVLTRRKFFTFISLFGISFTLAILMLSISALETELGSNAPLSDRQEMVFLDRLVQKNMEQDTTMLVDSSLVDGIMKFDTTYTHERVNKGTSISSFGLPFLQDHVADLDVAEKYSFYATGETFNSFVNETKVEIEAAYTDHRFWDLFDFQFIEGRPYDEQMVNSGATVSVITEKLAQRYFGTTKNLLGREVEMAGKSFKIIGLVPEATQMLLQSDMFVPSSTKAGYPGSRDEYYGRYAAAFLARNGNTDLLKHELNKVAESIPANSQFNAFMLQGKTSKELYANQMMYSEDPESAARWMTFFVFALLSLFALLPTLNLVNLNVSRIMDRSSEIGVRKAFGAQGKDLMAQFVFENIVLTVIGGAIGLLIAIGLIYLINDARLMESLVLQVNMRFFLYSMILVLFFGILSGLLPAYRMSRLHIVNALKQNRS